jgi:hypothetical protein
MNAQGDIREFRAGLGHGEIEIPSHHVEVLRGLCKKARKEYFRSVKQGLSSTAALACAENVQRSTKVDEDKTLREVAALTSKRIASKNMERIRRGRNPKRGFYV